MATFYLDLESGSDAADGTTFANRWKTFNSGATAARIAPGDTIRIMAATDQTSLGQNATWTVNSKTVTLTTAVTANISDCETAWTASANVTSTADTSQFKENTKSAKHVIAAGFTTGLAAYFATGTIDLSGYQQVSFWIFNTVAVAASTLSLRLCSDVAGVTTVNTIAIPAIPSVSQWTAFTVNTGGALDAAIQSVALYADLDPGAVTIQLDNIIACKASSSADALSLTSLLGKVNNLNWVASTVYAVNDIRKPTSPNRNGYRYKVTAQSSATAASEPTWPQGIGENVTDGGVTWQCEGLEDTWYAIQSINGTTVKLDNHVNALGSVGAGYPGATETVTTYKREPIKLSAMSTTSGGGSLTDIQDSGTAGNHITFSGGWNRTDMTTQTGETWVTGQNGFGYAVSTNGKNYLTFVNYNTTRFYAVFSIGTLPNIWQVLNGHYNNQSGYGILLNSATNLIAQGLISHNNNLLTTGGFSMTDQNRATLRAVSFCSHIGGSGLASSISYVSTLSVVDIVCKNNAAYGVAHLSGGPLSITGLITGNNTSGGINAPSISAILNNCLIAESTEFAAQTAYRDYIIYSQKHDQTANNHLLTTDGGTIVSATDQRHTASGISWKFLPTSTNRAALYPLRLSVAKVAVAASALVTLSIWARRDNTNIKGQLFVAGGQIAGVPNDVTVACEPSINTWTQSSNLTFTPTEAGVVEVLFKVWDGVGTSNSFWIDDFAVSQA